MSAPLPSLYAAAQARWALHAAEHAARARRSGGLRPAYSPEFTAATRFDPGRAGRVDHLVDDVLAAPSRRAVERRLRLAAPALAPDDARRAVAAAARAGSAPRLEAVLRGVDAAGALVGERYYDAADPATDARQLAALEAAGWRVMPGTVFAAVEAAYGAVLERPVPRADAAFWRALRGAYEAAWGAVAAAREWARIAFAAEDRAGGDLVVGLPAAEAAGGEGDLRDAGRCLARLGFDAAAAATHFAGAASPWEVEVLGTAVAAEAGAVDAGVPDEAGAAEEEAVEEAEEAAAAAPPPRFDDDDGDDAWLEQCWDGTPEEVAASAPGHSVADLLDAVYVCTVRGEAALAAVLPVATPRVPADLRRIDLEAAYRAGPADALGASRAGRQHAGLGAAEVGMLAGAGWRPEPGSLAGVVARRGTYGGAGWRRAPFEVVHESEIPFWRAVRAAFPPPPPPAAAATSSGAGTAEGGEEDEWATGLHMLLAGLLLEGVGAAVVLPPPSTPACMRAIGVSLARMGYAWPAVDAASAGMLPGGTGERDALAAALAAETARLEARGAGGGEADEGAEAAPISRGGGEGGSGGGGSSVGGHKRPRSASGGGGGAAAEGGEGEEEEEAEEGQGRPPAAKRPCPRSASASA